RRRRARARERAGPRRLGGLARGHARRGARRRHDDRRHAAQLDSADDRRGGVRGEGRRRRRVRGRGLRALGRARARGRERAARARRPRRRGREGVPLPERGRRVPASGRRRARARAPRRSRGGPARGRALRGRAHPRARRAFGRRPRRRARLARIPPGGGGGRRHRAARALRARGRSARARRPRVQRRRPGGGAARATRRRRHQRRDLPALPRVRRRRRGPAGSGAEVRSTDPPRGARRSLGRGRRGSRRLRRLGPLALRPVAQGAARWPLRLGLGRRVGHPVHTCGDAQWRARARPLAAVARAAPRDAPGQASRPLAAQGRDTGRRRCGPRARRPRARMDARTRRARDAERPVSVPRTRVPRGRRAHAGARPHRVRGRRRPRRARRWLVRPEPRVMTTELVAIDERRLLRRLDELAQRGALAGGGIYRALYTPAWVAATALVSDWLKDAGLLVRRDAVGNVWGRIEGARGGRAIVTGSHIDTVRGGGALDGALGVVAGIEAVASVVARYGRPTRILECVAICEEEGSRFNTNFWGARAIADRIEPDEATRVRDADGVTLADAMRGVGLDPAKVAQAVRRDLDTFVELHIEQGPILDDAGEHVAVVRTIAGTTHLEVTVRGEADHAGAAAMGRRRDALLGASAMTLAIAEAACRLGPPAVATVGTMTVEPAQ